MKNLSDFYDFLLPELPGCITKLLDQHLRLVARDWCAKTRLWREDFIPVDSVAGQDSYYLFPPEADAELVAVHKLTVNGTLLFDDSFNDWRWTGRWYAQPNYTSRTPVPRYDRSEPPFTISSDLQQLVMLIDEIPDAGQTDGIAPTGSMKPTMGAATLPDILYDQYVEDLRAGVLARLMAMADKPWSAPTQSGFYAGQYRAALNLHATNAQRGSNRALLRTRPH